MFPCVDLNLSLIQGLLSFFFNIDDFSFFFSLELSLKFGVYIKVVASAGMLIMDFSITEQIDSS